MTNFIDVTDDELLDELKRRFPAIVYAMQRNALSVVEDDQEGKMGWEGPLTMRLGLADALQVAMRLEFQMRMTERMNESDEEE